LRPWDELVALWVHLNRQLAQVIAAVPDETLLHPCVIGGNPPVALERLMEDYVVHLEHHLAQILEPVRV
jgi:hypothetical protein